MLGHLSFMNIPSVFQPPITFEWGYTNNLSRQQLPLQTSYAITIHKSQGQTLQKAVIDIGKSEHAPGTTFVAISRLWSNNAHAISTTPIYFMWS